MSKELEQIINDELTYQGDSYNMQLFTMDDPGGEMGEKLIDYLSKTEEEDGYWHDEAEIDHINVESEEGCIKVRLYYKEN